MKHEHKWVKVEILDNKLEMCTLCGAFRDANGKVKKAMGLKLKGVKK